MSVKSKSNKAHVKVGEEVKVIAGRCKGQTGKIKTISKDKQKVSLEGINLYKKSIKKTEDNPEGGFKEIEGLIHISNVAKLKKDAQKDDKKDS